MPLPVLLGLPWLATVIGTALIAVVTWLASYITKRVALAIAAVAAFAALTAAIVLSIEALFAGVIGVFPIAANVGLVLPDDFAATIAIYTSGRLLYWIYSVNWLMIQMRLM